MSEKIVVPVLGESITEATVAKWLKNAGDTVEADEPIVELETDKVNLEVPSPISGVLTEINSQDGSVVEVGALLGSVSAEGGVVKSAPKTQKEIKQEETVPAESNVIKLDANKKEPKVFEEKDMEEPKEKPLVLTEEVKPDVAPKRNVNPTLSPAVRKIVTENNIDINSIQGSGKDGRVLKGDLISLMGCLLYTSPSPRDGSISRMPSSA